MAINDLTILNSPNFPGGDVMDEVSFDYSPEANPVRKRPKVVIGDATDKDLFATVLSSRPDGDEPALLVRDIGQVPGTQVVEYDEITNVAASTLTTIASYTTPVSKTFHFTGLVCSGNTNAIFTLYVDVDKKMTLRNSVANLTTTNSYTYSPFSVSASSIISIKVFHYNTSNCDFEATILGYLI